MNPGNSKMGKVWVDLEVSNEFDEVNASEGRLSLDKVRKVQVKALVDTGATMLMLPSELIQKLGLRVKRKVKSRLADGKLHDRLVYGTATLRVQRRDVTVEIVEGQPGVPALLGQIPLEGLDLLVDSKNQRLIPNPESPDPEMALIDMF